MTREETVHNKVLTMLVDRYNVILRIIIIILYYYSPINYQVCTQMRSDFFSIFFCFKKLKHFQQGHIKLIKDDSKIHKCYNTF